MGDRLRAIVMALLCAVLATMIASCQLLGEAAPTAIPSLMRGQPTSEPLGVDESPRLRSAQDVPPTWTPAAAIRSETPISPEVAATVQPGSQASYTVQSGDTLADIAIRFNVSMEALAAANNIEDFDHIEAGQVLLIPK